MTRRWYSRKWLLMALALALVCWCQPASAYELEVNAWIDGYSRLIIQGSTVQWHNLHYKVPGREAGHNDPTNLSTADMGTVAWFPGWPDATTDPPQGDQFSTQFIGLNLPLAAVDQTVDLTKIAVRYDAFISQQPAAANSYTLIVDFNDDPIASAAYYTVRLDYAAVPLPGTLALLGPSLLGMTLWRGKKIFQR